MPKFILTKVPDDDRDGTLTYTFETDYLPRVQEHVEIFLEASGFAFPEEDEKEDEEDEEDTFEFRLTTDDFLAKEEDYMWDQALKDKFNFAETVFAIGDLDDTITFI